MISSCCAACLWVEHCDADTWQGGCRWFFPTAEDYPLDEVDGRLYKPVDALALHILEEMQDEDQEE